MTWLETPPVAVLLAQQFNPSVLNQVWLSKIGVLDQNGTVKEGSVFSGQLVQAITDDFVLAVVPDQLQFILISAADRHEQLINDSLIRLVEAIPHSPYHAIGLNFTWHLIPEEDGMAKCSRKWFGTVSSGIYSHFVTNDAFFGAFLSKDFDGFRLKLDIKPSLVIQVATGASEERIQFAFTFHADVPQGLSAASDIVRCLRNWNKARSETIEILKSMREEP